MAQRLRAHYAWLKSLIVVYTIGYPVMAFLFYVPRLTDKATSASVVKISVKQVFITSYVFLCRLRHSFYFKETATLQIQLRYVLFFSVTRLPNGNLLYAR